MFRLITCFLYISGFLIYSIPQLARIKKASHLPVEERDKLAHEYPKKFSKKFMKLTGSEVVVEGLELIPEGPVVFIANHESDFDIPVLLGTIDKPFGFVSKIELKKVPILSSWLNTINCILIDRKNHQQALNSMKEGVQLLQEGHSLVIFPEGKRSKGGPVQPFKVGGIRLAQDAGVPIVPIAIKGTADIFEKNGRLIKPAQIKVTIGYRIDPIIHNHKDYKEMAEEVRQIIIAMSEARNIAS
ncbi:lysophospholipid acyltransferase family protein [Neobacillus niacini]|uniref:lysophospholipid acyltransferase family protein n=1 Tax=Neobacillus niacini TaxID=86668 RepID=UPI00052F790D|nr:lysophospholipid acyltransferase family protein [Neobacillus niacini]KGM44736.1 acyl-phosphate glycerol 3-phosphate acyltransferase [Neobacillus niacini]MEC1521386.1 lysophospholipid acyltransferase family protein [Neobacillus niacini]